MGAKEEHMPNRLWIAKLILGTLVFAVSAPAQRPNRNMLYSSEFPKRSPK